MISRIINRIIDFAGESNAKRWTVDVTVFLLIILPVTLTACVGYLYVRSYLTSYALERQKAVAFLASTVLKERFDRLTDLGELLVSGADFRNYVLEGKWVEAMELLEEVPHDSSYIDYVFMADPSGTLMADTPPSPDIRGKNFAFRDWYEGVISTGKPYVSEVYQRANKPQLNVVAVAIPIFSEAETYAGILVFQIKLDTIFEWARTVNYGHGGSVYFTDKNGHMAAHYRFPAQEGIIDFSSNPLIQKALRGESGVDVVFDELEDEEMISAYVPVPGYGWAVVAIEPSRFAFLLREVGLQSLLTVFGAIFLITAFMSYFIVNLGHTIFIYRQRQKIFLESIGDGIVAIDRDWNIILWSDAASQLTGWSREDALGKPFRDVVKFVRERDRKENITFIEEAMLTGSIHFMENHSFLVKKDGSEIYIGDSASPIFDFKKHVSGAIIIFRDVTKEHVVQQAREEFSSLASHQLRSPVTAVKGYTELLLEEKAGVLNDEQKKYLKEIYRAGENMSALVNALLDVSRIELGTLAIIPEPVYIPDIAEEVLKDLSPKILDKEIFVEKIFAKELPTISVDPKLTKAIFENLLFNAVKYTFNRGKITVEISQKEREVLIRVANVGYGIPEKDQAKIFTKFFRASNISAKEPEGTGLGLYIVKSILEQAGGRIWFESVEGKETTFYVAIPTEGMKKREGIKGLS